MSYLLKLANDCADEAIKEAAYKLTRRPPGMMALTSGLKSEVIHPNTEALKQQNIKVRKLRETITNEFNPGAPVNPWVKRRVVDHAPKAALAALAPLAPQTPQAAKGMGRYSRAVLIGGGYAALGGAIGYGAYRHTSQKKEASEGESNMSYLLELANECADEAIKEAAYKLTRRPEGTYALTAGPKKYTMRPGKEGRKGQNKALREYRVEIMRDFDPNATVSPWIKRQEMDATPIVYPGSPQARAAREKIMGSSNKVNLATGGRGISKGKAALIGAGAAALGGAAYGAYRHFNNKTAALPMEEEVNRLFTKFDPEKVKAQRDGMDQLNRMYQKQTGSKEKLGDRFKNIDTSGFDSRRQEASDHLKRVMDDARANAAAKHYSRIEAEAAQSMSKGKKALIGAGIAAGAGAAYGAYRHFNNKTAGLPMDPNATLVNGHKFDTDDVRFKQKDITPRVLEQEAPKEKVRASWGSVKNGIKGNKKLFGAAAAVGGAGCLGAYMVHKNKKGGANET